MGGAGYGYILKAGGEARMILASHEYIPERRRQELLARVEMAERIERHIKDHPKEYIFQQAWQQVEREEAERKLLRIREIASSKAFRDAAFFSSHSLWKKG